MDNMRHTGTDSMVAVATSEEEVMTKYGHLTVNQRLQAERKDYRDFIERLARTELHVVPDELLDMLPRWYTCLRCAAFSPLGVATHVTEARKFVHVNCPVVEARHLLGWPTDEGGNLVEEER